MELEKYGHLVGEVACHIERYRGSYNCVACVCQIIKFGCNFVMPSSAVGVGGYTRAERSVPISTRTWESVKDAIYDRYIIQGHKQDEILAWLEQHHNLVPRYGFHENPPKFCRPTH